MKAAPVVDGLIDPIWQTVPETTVRLTEGEGDVSLKFLYTKTSIFCLVRYPDSSHNYIDRPWVFKDSSWRQEGQSDSVVLFWNTGDSIIGFNERGFGMLTDGLKQDEHPWNIAIEGTSLDKRDAKWRGQRGDFWSTGLQLPYGKAEDWVFKEDMKRQAVRDWKPRILVQHDENKFGVPWVLNKNADRTRPSYAYKPGFDLTNNPYPVLADMVPIETAAAPSPGDTVPFIVYKSREARWGGSKDDIDGAETWQDGVWTVEMGRALDTGHADDARFTPGASTRYVFGILLRREGRRYEPTAPVELIFEPQN